MTRLMHVAAGLFLSAAPAAAQTGFTRSSVTAGNFNILGSTAPAQTVNGQLVVRSTTGTNAHLLLNVRNQAGTTLLSVAQNGNINAGNSGSTTTAAIIYFGTAAPLGGVGYNLTFTSNAYIKQQLQVSGDLSVGMSTTIYTVGGRVGIGTASPLTTLDVNGVATLRGATTISGSSLTVTGETKLLDSITLGGGSDGLITWNSIAFQVRGAASRALDLGSNGVPSRLYLDTSGNVGIGAGASGQSPATKLHMSSGTLLVDGSAPKISIGPALPCSTCTLHVQGNASLGYTEVASMTATGAMTFSNSTWTQRGTTNTDFQARITNANSGTSAKTDLYISNDDSTTGSLEIGTGGTGLTAIVGEARAQDAGWLVSGANLSNGLSLAAEATSSNMRFYTGGSLAANLRAQYDGSNGSLTILSTVTLNTNTVAQTAALLQVGGAQTALTGTNIQLVNNPAAANGGIATKNTGGVETAMFAESGAAGSIGTTSNHQLKIITNNTSRMALDTLGAITTIPRISSTTLTIDGSGGAFTVGDANNALLASFFGPQRLYSRTKAQIDTLAATTVGQIVFVSNIATSGDVCVSTGTAAAQWRRIGTAAGCGTNE